MHPSFKILKTYLVKVKGIPSEYLIQKLLTNVGVCKIQIIGITQQKNTWIKVILYSGRNKQIINMFWQTKTPVLKIIRTKFANIGINKLGIGSMRPLSYNEIKNLYNQVKQWNF